MHDLKIKRAMKKANIGGCPSSAAGKSGRGI